MVQIPSTNDSDPKVPVRPTQFRPIRYEVQAEMDKLFGLSQMQKRQLALRHRDEDGRLWFDGLEEEEFRHLLQPRSIPNSPMSPFDCDISRRSSTATGMSNSVPSSPTNPYFPSSGHSFENTFARRRSSISTNFLLHFDDASDLQRRKSVPFMPLTAMLERGTNLQSETSVNSAEQAKDVQPVPLYRRRRNKRSRSDDDIHVQSKNKVFLERLTAEGDENPFENGVSPRKKDHLHITEKEIVMPSFLPIPRHRLDEKMLEEAFGPLQKSLEVKTSDNSITTNLIKRQSPNSSAGTSPSPTRMQREISNPILDADRFMKRSRAIDDNECTISSSKIDSNDDQSISKQKKERRNTTFITSDNPKAAAMLGMTPNNEKLLVPGGLETGEHVYDGIEIPCASVRLQSDDEGEDEDVKNTSRGLRTKFDRQKDRMKRALQ
ncbi:uncharacterized protein FA14DRAFT_94998 [Meira miltonrushii]|uniref:Uncharacterized protein n=1 Tax=Meira miltonrushii TaxID=1280837 RepID=A0A316V1T2_9BASI|nr:uncharacterized protein FA14DRAFT_94998 [Meira miltonrushii]PWN31507.1 hypothetical protein FA14DRAFT_94998 [Meira miltonrushii]